MVEWIEFEWHNQLCLVDFCIKYSYSLVNRHNTFERKHDTFDDLADKVVVSNPTLSSSGEKPFECKLCHQRSRDYSAMIKHLRTHNGASPYQCTICLEYCPSLSAMQKHMKGHKPEDIPPDWRIEKTYLYLCYVWDRENEEGEGTCEGVEEVERLGECNWADRRHEAVVECRRLRNVNSERLERKRVCFLFFLSCKRQRPTG